MAVTAFPADKLTRIVGVQWATDIEFIAVTVGLSIIFDVNVETDNNGNVVNVGPTFGDVGHGGPCEPSDRVANSGDDFNWLKRLRYVLFNGGGSGGLEAYRINETTDLGEWIASSTVLDPEEAADITTSPNYPNGEPTYESFSDWMYLALASGNQDWYHEYSAGGTTIKDSNNAVVMSPLLGVPFKTGFSTQKILNATRFETGPLCLESVQDPLTSVTGGALGSRETAHTVTISWNDLVVTFDDQEWEPVGYAVSTEHNATTFQIICEPAGTA